MPLGIETVVGYLSNAASTGAQTFTAGNQQSFNVRASNGSPSAQLVSVWSAFQDAGYVRIRSPRMHDDVNGIKIEANSTNPNPLATEYLNQGLYSQDSLTVEAFFDSTPTAAHTSAVAMQIAYPDLPGVAANLKHWAEIQPLVQSYMGVKVNPSSSGTAGQWGTGVAINSSDDVFKANSLYALLGFITPTQYLAFAVQGTDLGNLYYGAPGSTDPVVTRGYFARLSDVTGLPTIPVINSQNKGSTLVSIFDRATSTAYPTSLLFAYLGPTGS